ncbi:MAG: hypothetical protein ACRCUT_10520 [Spirochaetota bacterium]
MKKVIYAIICCVFVFSAAGCEKKVPISGEIKDFYKEMIQTTNSYADRLNAVKNGKEASSIVKEYIDAQKKLIGKGREISKKYPEFKFRDDPALKEYEKSLEQATIHFTESMSAAVKKYMAENEFREALSRFKEIEKEAEK